MKTIPTPLPTDGSKTQRRRGGLRALALGTVIGAISAPFVAAGTSVTTVPTGPSLCMAPQGVIGRDDISYLGAMRMPAAADTTFAYGGLTGRIVNGRVRLFLNGSNVGTPKDAVYEIEDPGGGYDPDYTKAPRATLVTNWGDIYHGKRTSRDAQGATIDLQYLYPGGMYWNENTRLLYWTYLDGYNVAQRADWGLGASSLDDPVSGASTAHGPWRAVATDADGKKHYGPRRCSYLFANPIDGTMMCGSSLMSGNSGSPWGPDAYGGRPWPTAATPSGPDLTLPNRYLEYYFMGDTLSPNYVDLAGKVHGQLRSFRRTTSLPIWEPGAGLRVNPALNGGVGSWSDLDGTGGGIWLQLTNKRGVLFATTLVGSPIQDPANCNAAHQWYSSTGTCPHGCASPVQITGPVTTAAFPALAIYDPNDLMAVRNGTVVDHTVDPHSVIDLEEAYRIQTANIRTVGAAKSIRGFYFDPVRKYLFVLAAQADDSAGQYAIGALIHVFAIRD